MRKDKPYKGARAPSQRQLRVGEELRHALVRILERGHFRDPDLAQVSVTVAEVRISPDLKKATAFVMPLAGSGVDQVVAALNRAAGYFRRELGRDVKLRFVPEITFEADTSFDYSNRIAAALARPDVARDLDHPEGDEDVGPGGA
jgi:ribosome-binding factor A